MDAPTRSRDLHILEEQLRKMDLRAEIEELRVKLDAIRWEGKDYNSLLTEVILLPN